MDTPPANLNPFNIDNFESEKLNSVDRLEAFSDGVFGVAITLLVLNIAVPTIDALNGSSLQAALLHQWPSYISYIFSFFSVGIVWANHHRTFTYINHADHTLRMLNLFLLMTVTLIPFTTQLLSNYIQPVDPGKPFPADAERTAAVVYSFGWVLLSVAYNTLWRYAIRKNLLDPQLTPDNVKKLSSRINLGLFLYLVALVGAVVDPIVGVLICFGLAIFYLIS